MDDEDLSNFNHNTSIKDAYDHYRWGKYAASNLRLLGTASFSKKRIESYVGYLRTIAKCRMLCFEATEEVDEGFNETLADYLTIMAKISEELNMIQGKYVQRYGLRPDVNENNRKRMANVTQRLQDVLETSPSVKRRKTLVQSRENHGKDPVSELPNEIISKIFEYLGVKDLAVVSQVCTKWYTAVMDLTEFLTDPSFPKDVAIPHFAKYLRVCGRNHIKCIKKISASGLSSRQQSRILQQLSKEDIEIQALELGIDNLQIHRLQVGGGLSSLSSLTLCLNSFKKADLQNLLTQLTRLKTLQVTIDVGHCTDSEDIEGLSVSNLDFFRLSIWDAIDLAPYKPYLIRFIERCKIVNVGRLQLDSFPVTGEMLEVILNSAHPHWLRLDTAPHSISLEEVANACKRSNTYLTHLFLTGTDFLHPTISFDLSIFSRLESLTLSCMRPPWESLLALLDATNGGLTSLGLNVMSDFGQKPEFSLTEVLKRCPLLQSLLVFPFPGDAGNIHEDLGKALNSQCPPHLETLYLRDATDDQLRTVFKPDHTPHSFVLRIWRPLKQDTVAYLRNNGYCRRICVEDNSWPDDM